MTDACEALEQLAGRAPVEIDDGIFELSPPVGGAHYDRIARLYGAALGTKLYNRVLWGTTPDRYRAFATQVFESGATGTDARTTLSTGCDHDSGPDDHDNRRERRVSSR